jgi:hypothetical protein
VKHSANSDAPVNTSTDQVPDCGSDFFEGHRTTALTTKKKKASVVITVLTTACFASSTSAH